MDTCSLPPLELAPHHDGTAPTVITAGVRRVAIVGANGAGKTRFASYLADHTAGAYRVNSLRALFDHSYTDAHPGSIDLQYAATSGPVTLPSAAPDTTQAERLTALIMRREMIDLLQRKLSRGTAASDGDDGKTVPDKPTALDRLIGLWQEIFPQNRILVDAGQLMIEHQAHPDRYPTLRLSAGERAVLYLIGAVLMAPNGAEIFVDSPEMFLHPSITQGVWNGIEQLRTDCRFIYVTHDLDFVSGLTDAPTVWVRSFNPADTTWDYRVLPADAGISDEIYSTILGARKPVLFIEGDGIHSIDAKLYPLIFREYTVKSLGSCNKVIEATRTFNDLKSYHHMDSYGIVDRDRRDSREVAYLRRKKVMVPDVAEIENILMLEGVVRAVARYHGKNDLKVFMKVKRSVLSQFASELRQQALMHTRHRVKRIMECRIDGRFKSINSLEHHLRALPDEINATAMYEGICRDFHTYLQNEDYGEVLKVYNQKSMLPQSNVATLCGLRDKDQYIASIIRILKRDCEEARSIREAVARCFGLG